MLKFHNHKITHEDAVIHFLWVYNADKKRYIELCLRKNIDNIPYVLHTYYNENPHHPDEIKDAPYRMKCGYPTNARQIANMFIEYNKRTYKPKYEFEMTPEVVMEWLENPTFIGEGTYKPENLEYTQIEEYYQ